VETLVSDPAPDGSASEAGTRDEPDHPPPERERSTDPERSEWAPEPVGVGLLAAPGLAYEIAEQLARELPGLLRRRFPGVEWNVEVGLEPMAAASQDDVDLVEIAHKRLLAEGWKLAICLTDNPVHVGNRPVTAHASATHGVGLVSVPALGAVNLDDRVRTAVLRLVEGLLGEQIDDPESSADRGRYDRMRRRLEDLASPVGRAEVHEDRTIRFVSAVWRGNLRLLIGMVRANRPWRLIAGLSRAIVGALGLDIFGVASPGIWLIADGMTWPRLLVFGVASIVIICASLVTAHGLWERTCSPRPETRERVILFNLTTAFTVAIGVLTLYLALFAINVVAAVVLIPEQVLSKQVGHPVAVADYARLAWLVTSLATLGGALGAALENDRAVREAAYGYRPDARTEADRGEGERARNGAGSRRRPAG
jgi:uncharacterized membrane protein